MVVPGLVLGERFRVLGELGEGGTATVYLAEDLRSGGQIALKVLHPHLASRPSVRARLHREVEAARRLTHPHILSATAVHDLGAGLALEMPVHTGRTLQEHVSSSGPLSEEALWRLGRQLSDALAHAHRAGVVHRDMTPSNVMIDAAGDVVLTDFGTARLGTQATARTQVIATPGYAAPEIYDGHRAEPRSDLYALGAVMVFAATGQPPFGDGPPMQVLQRQSDDRRVRLHRERRDLSLPLCENIEAMLSARPVDRPQGAAAVSAAFTERRPLPVAAGGALLSLPSDVSLALQPGDWIVTLRERDADARRRSRLRQEQRGDHGIESVVVGALASAGRRILSALSMPAPKSPEDRLVAAVASAAGLPADALEAPPALLEREFVLLSGVDEHTARTVSLAAQDAGFLVDTEHAEPDLRKSVQYQVVSILAVATLGAGFGMALTGGGFSLIILSMAILLLLGLGVPGRPPLPEAVFDRELLAHLSPQYRIAQQPSQIAEIPSQQTPLEAVQQRALTQIADLELLLGSGAVPDVVASDLRTTLTALRWQAEELRDKALILQTVKDTGAETLAAVAHVEARLVRLSTLEQAGKAVSRTERRELESALAAHQAALDEQETADAELTRVMARFLELGATVAHCRRLLADSAVLDQEGEEVLERLRVEVHRATVAQDELEAAQRRRRAFQARQQRT